jgi:hypothetical protein
MGDNTTNTTAGSPGISLTFSDSNGVMFIGELDPACAAMLGGDRAARHFVGVVVDAGPELVSFMVDGVLCDGGGVVGVATGRKVIITHSCIFSIKSHEGKFNIQGGARMAVRPMARWARAMSGSRRGWARCPRQPRESQASPGAILFILTENDSSDVQQDFCVNP